MAHQALYSEQPIGCIELISRSSTHGCRRTGTLRRRVVASGRRSRGGPCQV